MLIDWPEVNQYNPPDRVWCDATRHCPSWQSYAVKGDWVSTAHECTHGANAAIRNARGGNLNAFYVLRNQAIVSPEPNLRKSAVAEFIPANLRSDRFPTYVTGQSEWDDSPLYLWDEWSAYTNGAFAAADLSAHGEYRLVPPIDTFSPAPRFVMHKGERRTFPKPYHRNLAEGWSDWAMGPLEFNCYGLAVMAAASLHDAAGYAALKDDFRILWDRGWLAHQVAAAFFPWEKQDAYRSAFASASGPLAATMADLDIDIPGRNTPPA